MTGRSPSEGCSDRLGLWNGWRQTFRGTNIVDGACLIASIVDRGSLLLAGSSPARSVGRPVNRPPANTRTWATRHRLEQGTSQRDLARRLARKNHSRRAGDQSPTNRRRQGQALFERECPARVRRALAQARGGLTGAASVVSSGRVVPASERGARAITTRLGQRRVSAFGRLSVSCIGRPPTIWRATTRRSDAAERIPIDTGAPSGLSICRRKQPLQHRADASRPGFLAVGRALVLPVVQVAADLPSRTDQCCLEQAGVLQSSPSFCGPHVDPDSKRRPGLRLPDQPENRAAIPPD